MPCLKTGSIHYHAQLTLPERDRAIKGLVYVFNRWNLEPLILLNGLALGCYQLSPEVLFELKLKLNHSLMFN